VDHSLPTGKTAIWEIEGHYEDIISLTLVAEDFMADFMLIIIDPNGVEVARHDRAGAGASEQIIDMDLSVTGVYQVQVLEFFDRGGSYRLLVSRN
jgi:hypothetical protein